MATGLAGSFATGKVLGATNRIRFGVIGYGERGTHLAREAMACPETELVATADVYSRRREEAVKANPGTKAFNGYQDLLEDPTVDAVFIATPQHLHAECFLAAIRAGKHVYIEKAMALTVEDALLMRALYLTSQNGAGTKPVVQIGHQHCSSGHLADATNYLAAGYVGQVTAIRAHMYRNTPHGKPQWTRPVYTDMTPDQLDWKAFTGPAPVRAFDADRYTNWRLFNDYSGGNIHENMSHQIAFWYKVADMAIPHSVTMTGDVYRWQDGREVPDTMNVTMAHDAGADHHGVQFSWDSGFGNNHLGVTEEVLGTDGTILRGQQIRYQPQKVNRPEGSEILGQTPTAPRAHVQNFFDCIRNGNEPNCPLEIGFRVSVTCAMALASYRLRRTVYWDSVTEELV